MNNYESRVLGSCLGEAIGDALGFTVEFDSSVTPSNRKVKDIVLNFTDSDGRHVSRYSDDTQMMRAVAEGLIEGGTDFEDATTAVAQNFIRWAAGPDGGHRAPGGTCLRGCAKLASGVSPLKAGDFVEETGGGCGAVMRSAPYGWMFPTNSKAAAVWAAKHACMTHGASIGQASSAALAFAVSALLHDQADPYEVICRTITVAQGYSEHTARMIAEAAYLAISRTKTDTEVLDQFRGWAGHEAIAAGVYCFLRHPHAFSASILLAVNSPGDSDSIGAITGALSGAFLGHDLIPENWIEGIEKRDQLIDLAGRFAKRFDPNAATIPPEEITI